MLAGIHGGRNRHWSPNTGPMDWLRRPVKGSLLTDLMKAAVAPQSKQAPSTS
jgi:hypothetical protein